MSELQATPGPWFVERDAVTVRVVHGEMDQYGKRDDVFRAVGSVRSETANANAHLIASAPDLYMALKAMALAFDVAIFNRQISPGTENSNIANAASQALAKARGEK